MFRERDLVEHCQDSLSAPRRAVIDCPLEKTPDRDTPTKLNCPVVRGSAIFVRMRMKWVLRRTEPVKAVGENDSSK
jgi:hypothetical protein